jgi:YfiH family protein
MMQRARGSDFLTIPRLDQIPYLVHGFGAGKWKDADFRKPPEWSGFSLLFLNQVHSDTIRFIDRIPEKTLSGDAMVTNIPGLLLIIRTADCLPVLIVDESQKVITAVHCGWRGTSKRVVHKAIQGMVDRYGCHASSFLVALGPCIGSECYEVGEDVLQAFEKEGLSTESFRAHPSKKKKYLFDLKGENLSQMMSLGIEKENIHCADGCTHCDESLPSYRRDRDKSGRMLSFIGMSF